MKDLQIVVESALPSVALVAKYPSLKNLASTGLAMIEDAIVEFPKATGDTDIVWAERFAAQFEEPVLQEAVKFYNTVVQDGRFISLLGGDPRGAATQLGLTVSDGAFTVLEMARDQTLQAPNIALLSRQRPGITPFVGPAAAIAVVVAVAVVGGAIGWKLAEATPSDAASPPDAGARNAADTYTIVIDRSGMIKL